MHKRTPGMTVPDAHLLGQPADQRQPKAPSRAWEPRAHPDTLVADDDLQRSILDPRLRGDDACLVTAR